MKSSWRSCGFVGWEFNVIFVDCKFFEGRDSVLFIVEFIVFNMCVVVYLCVGVSVVE